jgi:hypothetical protein
MRIPDGAHTHHGHGGGGIGVVVLILFAAAIAAKLAAPAVAAVGELLRAALIVVVVLAGVAGAGLVALAAVRVHRWRVGGNTRVSLPAPIARRAVQPASEPPPAIEQRGQLHLHFHGVDAEDVAAIIAQRDDGRLTGDFRATGRCGSGA